MLGLLLASILELHIHGEQLASIVMSLHWTCSFIRSGGATCNLSVVNSERRASFCVILMFYVDINDE